MSMNLHSIASRAISKVNPNEWMQYQASTGSVTSADGSRVPSYAPAIRVLAQVQETTQDDLKKGDALNIQGEKVKLWMSGSASGVVRMSNKGGDLFGREKDGTQWLVLSVLETWPEWCAVLLVRQMPKASG
jgi:hypothetical protein